MILVLFSLSLALMISTAFERLTGQRTKGSLWPATREEWNPASNHKNEQGMDPFPSLSLEMVAAMAA